MDNGPLMIGLVRVSTEKQEESGLGLDAQLAAIERLSQFRQRRPDRNLYRN